MVDIENLLKIISDKNKMSRKVAICANGAFLAICYFVFNANNDLSVRGILPFLVMELAITITVVEVSRFQWDRYLFVSPDNTKEAFMFSKSIPVSRLLRLHAFPVEKYFCAINKKMIPNAIFLSLSSIIIGICHIQLEEMEHDIVKTILIICFGVVNGMIPYIVGALEKKYMLYQGTTNGKTAFNLMLKGINKVLRGIYAIVGLCLFCCVELVVIAVFTEALAPNMKQSEIIFRCYSYQLFIVSFVLLILAFFFWLISRDRKKKTILIMIGLVVGVFLVFYVEGNIYTEFAGNKITVHNLIKEKCYTLEDVETFRIYEENESIQMELYIKDGEQIKMMSGVYTNSDKYAEIYYSEYHYIADYVKALKTLGIEGTLEEVDALREAVKDMDKQLEEGLENIIGVMGE